MLSWLSAHPRSWPLAVPFRISRGLRTTAEVVEVHVRDGGHVGRGESTPYARYGETIASVLGQIETLTRAAPRGIDRAQLQQMLPPGAARNAVDAALWDLESQRRGVSVATLLGQTAPPCLPSAQTIGLDTAERMASAARGHAHLDLLKIKVGADDPAHLIRAVREAAPQARLMVDPNESWTLALLQAMQPVLAEARVELVEQPLPAGEDAQLAGFDSTALLCADESCHVATDLPRLRGLYQVVNIKLDKTGGLTGALSLLDAAQAQGFDIMVGCMGCSSLAIAPALHVARHARFIDLDGPLWLRDDHPGGVSFVGGLLQPTSPQLWGGGLRSADTRAPSSPAPCPQPADVPVAHVR
ncbi:N-acetyl-D-Glu racemase DgcA [Luteimonas sp. RC10]|uniref:N-acetyl-D-Glu racemase DgcA n=1 Tax=Luteimonas sp. RC10 TaxID=2587035 RepID=UPI0016174F3E|nr:N-acetyl-D-Glu racemase DgcA [Luteimonas sp. RC10]MBB3344555.1 L-alanine-DL-glutamate epimerase-like enolase superfamily enzyme [Luteimonas sp. RC10]